MKKIAFKILSVALMLMLLSTSLCFAAAPTVVAGAGFVDAQENGTFSKEQPGYNGNTAIKLQANGENVNAAIRTETFGTYGLSESNSIVTTMRIKLSGEADESFNITANMNTGYSNCWVLKADAATDKYRFSNEGSPLESDKWYNIVTIFSGQYASTYVYDAVTGSQMDYIYAESYGSVPSGREFILWVYNLGENSVLIDETSIYCVNSDNTFSLDVANSTVADSEIAVDGTLVACFDQPVTPSASMFKIKDSSNNEVANAIQSISVKDFNKVELKLAGLNGGTDYILDCSQVKSAAQTTINSENATISFKTKKKKVFMEKLDGTISPYKFTSSEIFDGGPENGTYNQVTGYNGETGDGALKIAKNETWVNSHLLTHSFEKFGLSQNTTLTFNTRFKLEGTPSKDFYCTLSPNSSMYVLMTIKANENGEYQYSDTIFENGHWYDMSLKITTESINMNIFNSQTGQCVVKDAEMPFDGSLTRTLLFEIAGMNEEAITFDDVAVYATENSDTMTLISKEETVEEDNKVSMEFDMPITPSAEMFSGVTIDKIYVKDFKKAIVYVANLDYSTSYTFDFSNIKSTGGAVLTGNNNTISFITKEAPKHKISIVGDIEGAEFVNGALTDTKLNFSINNNTLNTIDSITVIAAIYTADEVFLGSEIGGKTNIARGQNKIALNFEKDYTNVSKVKLFIWTGLSELVPLAESREILPIVQ